MKFRTEINPAHAPFNLTHSGRIFLAGSCFSEHIHAKLRRAKFNVTANPFGILFNPASIYEMFEAISENRIFNAGDLYGDGNRWYGWLHHGAFSDIYPEVAVDKINRTVTEGAEALAHADYVIITFGTAWIYSLADTGRVVANCHKQPSTMFDRRRLTIPEIVRMYGNLLEGVLKGKTVIFTVSPVRHLKDGFEENSLSKSILRAAIAELTEGYGNAHYFPSYEIMNDDLRDYRFYADDMLHPSQRAVDYVWEKFADWAMDKPTLEFLPEIEKIALAMKHRVLHGGETADNFFANMADKVKVLQCKLPGVDFGEELKYFTEVCRDD